MDLPYKIKTVLSKKAFFTVTLLFLITITYVSLSTGEFDLGMFIFQFIGMCIVMCIIFFTVSKTIILKSDELIYKGLLKKFKISYKNVSMISALKTEDDNDYRYSLVIFEKNAKYGKRIFNIQNYKQTDIELLIDTISIENQSIYLISDKLKDLLSEVWLRNRNRSKNSKHNVTKQTIKKENKTKILDKIELPYKIKPMLLHLFKKGFFIFNLCLIIGVTYESISTAGKFVLDDFIDVLIMMCIFIGLFLCICFFVVNKTIVLDSDELIYKGLIKIARINYKNIVTIDVNGNGGYYSLFITEKNKNRITRISNIQRYKQTDIEFFIDTISKENQSIYLISDKLKDLDDVYLNSKNCK